MNKYIKFVFAAFAALVTIPMLGMEPKPSKSINKTIIRVVKGDIAKQDTQAIVNAANTQLQHGAGIAKAISTAAGVQLQQHCNRLPQVNGVRCPVGGAVYTPSFNLAHNTKCIIHAVGPDCRIKEQKENKAKLLKKAYKASLACAQTHGATTIAIPSISTGIFGYESKEATRIAVDAVVEYVTKHSHFTEVRFVAWDNGTYDLLVNRLNKSNTSSRSESSRASSSNEPSSQPLIKYIVPRGIKFDNKGHFADSDAVIHFMKQAAREGKVSDSFKDIKEARMLAKEAKTANYHNEQLVMVTCANGKAYVVKEIKRDEDPLGEISRLERARTSQRLGPYIHPNKTDGLRFVFPASYVQYKDKHGKDHTLVIMPKAKGVCLQTIMERFKRNPHDNTIIKDACLAYYDVGMAMAKFYKKHGTLNNTVIHKDFHHGNIFYDAHKRLVTLIDNERVAKTLEKPSDISNDLSHLFVTSPFVIEWGNSKFLCSIDLKRWYKITVPSFMLGFIRAYPQEERLAVFAKIKDLLLKWNTAVNRDDSREIRGLIKEVLIKNDKNDQNLEQQLLVEHKSELHIAAGNPDLTKLVKIMIDEGTTAIKKRDTSGNTPLHEAAYYNCLKTAKLLLAKGCQKTERNNKDETPLFKAKFKKNQNLVTLLS